METKKLSAILSVRIKKETKDTLERNGIDIPETVRAYLDKLAWKTQSKKNLIALHRMIEKNVKPSAKGFSAASIREDRDDKH